MPRRNSDRVRGGICAACLFPLRDRDADGLGICGNETSFLRWHEGYFRSLNREAPHLATTSRKHAVLKSMGPKRQYRTIAGILMVLTLAAPTGSGVVAAEQTVTPMERVASTPKGELKSPYADFASVAEEGHRKYMAAGCNGCHGGGGGGGMAPPLTNPVWIYGDDDDTLFRLIALGTGKLSPGDAFGKLGYRRKGSEAVVGPMPPFGEIIKTDDDLWKIIAWMRSVHCSRRVEDRC